MNIKLQTGILAGVVLISALITNNIYPLKNDSNKIVIKASDVEANVLSGKQVLDYSIWKRNNNKNLNEIVFDNDLKGSSSSGNSDVVDIQNVNSVQGDEADVDISPTEVREMSSISSDSDIISSCGDFSEKPTANILLAKDINSGSSFFEKNIYYRWPIASLSKLMVAVVVMDQYDFSKKVEITKDIIDSVKPYNTFKEGEKYSINDLVRATLVASSNDAAYALASVLGKKKFVFEMNKKAKKLGMSDTIFWEPSGLSYLNQSTASDLYRLIKYIHDMYPSLLGTTRRRYVYITDLAHHKKYKLKNIDEFAGMDNFYGGKTGYIDESGENLLTLFQKDGKTIAIMVLGSSNRFGDIKKIYNCIK